MKLLLRVFQENYELDEAGSWKQTPKSQPGSVQSSRYTPPIDRSQKVSPRWFGILIIAMFALGVLIVILNYAGLLPGGVHNAWLIAAIGAIFAGLLLATRYH